jgi:RecA/RadA recombinase
MTDQSDRLDQVISNINAKWGQHTVTPLAYTLQTYQPLVLSTGFPDLDHLLDGGFVGGHLTELSGEHTSGIATIAFFSIASAQKRGEMAVYLDMLKTFDPVYAVQCGIHFDALVIVRPENVAEGLDIATEIITRYRAGIVVFGQVRQGWERTAQTALHRFVNALRRANAVVIVLTRSTALQQSVFHPHAGTQLVFKRLRWLRKRKLIEGYLVQVTVLKHTGRMTNNTVSLRVALPQSGKNR